MPESFNVPILLKPTEVSFKTEEVRAVRKKLVLNL
tara:strand:+ start:1109 stop:1213 length:105 start_codon:yes stop_codon:yes gene_type:complete